MYCVYVYCVYVCMYVYTVCMYVCMCVADPESVAWLSRSWPLSTVMTELPEKSTCTRCRPCMSSLSSDPSIQMYVCSVCVYVCSVCMYVSTCGGTYRVVAQRFFHLWDRLAFIGSETVSDKEVHMYMCMYVCMWMYVYVCMYVCVYVPVREASLTTAAPFSSRQSHGTISSLVVDMNTANGSGLHTYIHTYIVSLTQMRWYH